MRLSNGTVYLQSRNFIENRCYFLSSGTVSSFTESVWLKGKKQFLTHKGRIKTVISSYVCHKLKVWLEKRLQLSDYLVRSWLQIIFLHWSWSSWEAFLTCSCCLQDQDLEICFWFGQSPQWQTFSPPWCTEGCSRVSGECFLRDAVINNSWHCLNFRQIIRVPWKMS